MLWSVGISRLGERVVRALLWRQLGPNRRYHREGIPISSRELARELGVSASGIDATFRRLRDRHIVARSQVYNAVLRCFSYVVIHPAFWLFPEGVNAPTIGGELEAVNVDGWPKPVVFVGF